jgi:hypothetical protein
MADSSSGRLIGVLTSPEKTFQSIRERPSWVVALLVVLLVGAGVYLVMSQRMDMAEIVRESIAAQDREVPPEQAEAIIDFYDRFGRAMAYGFIFVLQPILWVLATLCLWVATRLVGGEATFKQGWATVIHSQLPQAVGGLLSLPAILSRDTFHFEDVQTGSVLPSNLGFLAPEGASAAVLSLLSAFDLFKLWTLVLLVIGFAAVARLKKGTAAAAVVGCWALYVLGKAGWAAIFG